jgi:3-isopropylmalate/(R)-2-methylmalate dehydratase small subunit
MDLMEPLRRVGGPVAPLPRADVDTDQIIPKQFLKSVERKGYGENLFYDWRRKPDGSPNPAFVLNRSGYEQAVILAAGRNFGCGSSREHAAWALHDFGIRVVLAPSFADIFRSNCFKNGVLPIELPEADVERIIAKAEGEPGYSLTVDLESCTIRDGAEVDLRFSVDEFARRCLLEGLDDIGLTMLHEDKIGEYERSGAPAGSPARVGAR